ncbi:hypothetical protein BV20DRAFT_1034438 [Pilatotrama ljubarskyi]|nr:hypothetical protein BV20DRAFT_1034438 [Pilatotrama ljubarskyi]
MAEVDRAPTSKQYRDLISPLPHHQANLLIQLRTNHVPLQTDPHRIGKPETVAHYLLTCQTYALHRAVHFTTLGFSGRTLATLLNSKEAIQSLLTYVNATGRFRSVFSALDNPLPDDNSDSG